MITDKEIRKGSRITTAMEIGHTFSHECTKVILTKREKIMLLRKHSSSIAEDITQVV